MIGKLVQLLFPCRRSDARAEATAPRGARPNTQRRRFKGRGLGWLLAGLLCGAVLPARAASFRAVIEPATVRLGESAQLQLLFEGGVPDVLPTLPAVTNLTFSFIGREERFSFVNGRASSTTVFRYLVSPAAAGLYIIPALTVSVAGQRLESAPLRLTVLAGGAGGGTAPGASIPRASLRIDVPRTNLYVGEVLPVELALHAINPRRFELGQLPAEGFTLGPQERIEDTRVLLNGVFYTRTGIRTTVTPTRAGPLQLGPVNGRVEVLVPVARRRGDLFDEFFSDPFFNRATEVLVADVAAEVVPLTVWPLPSTNVPPGFTGAVGDFRMEVAAAPTNVAVGDPIRLQVRISGRGALAGITLPPLDGWSDFRVYPALSRVENTDTLGLKGAKVIEHDLVPQNAEVKAVPALIFSYFDPVHATYVSLTNPPIPLLVRPVGGRGPVLAAAQSAPPPREIVHLKPRLGPVAVTASPSALPAGFWLAVTAPVGLWLAVSGWRRHRQRLEADPRRRRQRAVARQVRQGLRELDTLAARGDAAGFFALVFRLLQEQLGEKLNAPAASITEAVVDERLVPSGADAALCGGLHALFQACNQARYAPTGAPQDLRVTAERVRRTLDALRRLELP